MFETCVNGGLHYLRSASLSGAGGVSHAFSTRLGGVSEGALGSLNFGFSRGDDPGRVRENYRLFCDAAGVSAPRLAYARQVHSDIVQLVEERDAGCGLSGRSVPGDALVTACPDLPLACFYADCVPILLADPVHRVVAAVHAGWRGTVSGILRKAVGVMEELGARPSDLLAAIGPCIGLCHYEVGEDVVSAASDAFGGRAAELFSRRDGRVFMDLRASNLLLLEQAGVPRDQVSVCPDCTYCDSERYFSHRRDGERRGVHMAVISLR